MRTLLISLLFGFFVVMIHSRPPQPGENNESQEDYESDSGSQADNTFEESHFKDEDLTGQEVEQNRRLLDLNRNMYLQKNIAEDGSIQTSLDIPDYKSARNRDVRNERSKEAVNTNDEYQFYNKRRQSNKYIDNNDAEDQLDAAQPFTNRDVNNYKNSRIHNSVLMDNPLNKRTAGAKTTPAEESDLLFDSNHDQLSKVDINEFNNNGPLDINQRISYGKQYYNQIHSDNKELPDANCRNSEYYYSRETRDAKKSNQADSDNISNIENSNDSVERTDTESEEMAIRRHIKKLSEDELEELFNSLSEDKRALLKKIIDDAEVSDNTYNDVVNKREITKKAGAFEDNGYIDSQSESSKIRDGVSSMDISTEYPTSQNCEVPVTTKQTETQSENTVLSNSKSSQEINSENKVELKNNNLDKSDTALNSIAQIADSNNKQAEATPNEQATLKNENKRETNVKEISIDSIKEPNILENEQTKQLRGNDGYFCSEDENMSKFLDEDLTRFYDSSKMYKRDVDTQSELDSKLKSLEESFPNSNAYDDSEPYTGPLIRVKRKNTEQVMKKRSAAVLPDAKVGFFPYKAENNDEDSDEGNEFDDDGFYDPAPNFVNSDNKKVESNQQTGHTDATSVLKTADRSKSPIITDAKIGTMSLGSDTDNVLSGVEGVDENLMFSSGIRNRRKTEENISENIVEDTNLIQPAHGKTSDKDAKAMSNMRNLNYQENDAFGGLSHNYDSDLGRYKRVRRVKQSRASDEPSPNT